MPAAEPPGWLHGRLPALFVHVAGLDYRKDVKVTRVQSQYLLPKHIMRLLLLACVAGPLLKQCQGSNSESETATAVGLSCGQKSIASHCPAGRPPPPPLSVLLPPACTPSSCSSTRRFRWLGWCSAIATSSRRGRGRGCFRGRLGHLALVRLWRAAVVDLAHVGPALVLEAGAARAGLAVHRAGEDAARVLVVVAPHRAACAAAAAAPCRTAAHWHTCMPRHACEPSTAQRASQDVFGTGPAHQASSS